MNHESRTKANIAGFQGRVIAEREELHARLTKLTAFTLSDQYKALPWRDRDLLGMQKISMGDYLSVLDQRIARFSNGS